MGQIAFFRSGNEPIVLNEQQRNSRKEACIKQLMEGKSMNNRFSQNIPNLGGVQPSSANSATESAEELANGDRQSLIGRNNECVICMDNQRDCVLHPCHHLCVCIKCGRLLLKRTDSCPICRRPISNAFRIYHS
ncbi:PREDICTED: probable E3 ubiquitin-protein ligase LUL2 [Rhagoletis zephyria]|uniref:probable E3 ubiquitin-protein ligase LUL2 n=1 Tax=Rhagoletis zephyria TaxID=28612 RepID=UPI0008112A52|nr:PREDICTED: probable E3 ubiquitin-protein ligase LUL2 [Rhagoletis zephyria]